MGIWKCFVTLAPRNNTAFMNFNVADKKIVRNVWSEFINSPSCSMREFALHRKNALIGHERMSWQVHFKNYWQAFCSRLYTHTHAVYRWSIRHCDWFVFSFSLPFFFFATARIGRGKTRWKIATRNGRTYWYRTWIWRREVYRADCD